MSARPSSREPGAERPVRSFKPTSGALVGWVSIVSAAVIAGYLAAVEPTVSTVRVVIVLAAVALVSWMALLRPRAVAYRDRLVLRNIVRDTTVPLARVDIVTIRQTLMVWVGEERYVCVGIGRSARKLLKRRSRGAMSVLGVEQADDRLGHVQVAELDTSGDYHTFVENQIFELARAARRDRLGEGLTVETSWARTELVVLGVLVLAFVVSLLV